MPDEDRERLNLGAYDPWPRAHSAHLGASPVFVGEEPDWREAAESLNAEFGTVYTPEEVSGRVTSKLNL